jgi:hypothetical protein
LRVASTLAIAILALMAIVPMQVFAAVTISSFTAKAKSPQIEVNWATATEINNSGFNLLRSTTQNGSYDKIAGLIPAKKPGSILGASYSYTDSSVTSGQTYFYKLQSVESSGGTQQFGPVSAAVAQPVSPTPTNTPVSSPVPAATNTPTTAPSSTPAPLFTASALPSTTQASSPGLAGSTSTPVPATTNTPATAPSSRPPQLDTATALPSTTQASSPGLAGSKPSPTSVLKVARAAATSTQDGGSTSGVQDLPTPAVTLVAIGIKQSTPQPDASSVETDPSAATEDSSSIRSYYFDRLIITGVLLASALMVVGALVLGAFAVYFFIRVYVH